MSRVDKNKSATALKVLRVLEAVAASFQPVSAPEVAESVGVDKATAYRMLMTLTEAGYATRHDASKRYSLSYKVVSLSRNLLIENKVFHLIWEALKRLSDETHETLHYSVLDGDETVLVHRVRGIQLVTVDFQIGDRSKLHCTSIGKVILAFQDIRFIERIIAAGLPKFARNTITDPDKFRQELQRIRSQGYALDDHEFADNMRCIAVSVFEGEGRVSGRVSISGSDSRFTWQKLEELKVPMLKASRELSKQLGGLP